MTCRGFCALVLLVFSAAAAAPVQARGLEGLITGVNGVLTAPADPIAYVITPPDYLEEVPLPAVSGRVLGAFSGTVLAARRAALGAVDVALTPLWIVPTLSPEARFQLLPLPEPEKKR